MSKKTRQLATAATLLALLLPLSLSGDSRRLARTSSGSTIDVLGRRGHEQSLHGYVRSVRNGGRDIVLTSTYGVVNIVGDRSTPVYYRGQRHRIDDLERGDQVRVFGDFDRDMIYAQSIEVLRSVSEIPGRDTRGETQLRGRITSIDRRSDEFQIATFDGQRVWVEARDLDRGERRQLDRLRIGDPISLHGFFDRSGTFIASSVNADYTFLRDRRRRRDDDERDRRFDRRRHHDDEDDDEGEDDEDEDD